MRSATRVIVVDSRFENMTALREAGWSDDDVPAGTPEPKAWPLLWWEHHEPGPSEPHPEWLKATRAARRVKEPAGSVVEAAYVSDPLMEPDIPPLPAGMTHVSQIKPREERIRLDEEERFQAENRK